ncbi:MAG: hypothetical protein ACJAVA_000234 [Flavobacteriaceae bacterium]|jgi:hypothetical protein
MSRKKLLELSLNEDKNVKSLVEAVITKDKKFITRAINDLEREIEDIEEDIEKRLSSGAPIDVALIEVTYRGLMDKEETLGLYKEFEDEYLKDSE